MVTLELRPEIAQGLEHLASAQGISIEEYLQRLVASELSAQANVAVFSRERHGAGKRATGLPDGQTTAH
jgi:hypothetical protein